MPEYLEMWLMRSLSLIVKPLLLRLAACGSMPWEEFAKLNFPFPT